MSTKPVSHLAMLFVLLLLLTLALPALSVPTLTDPSPWFIAGYVQGRFTQGIGPESTVVPFVPPNATFDVRRAYLYMKYSSDEHISAVIMAGLTPIFSLQHAYVQYNEKPFSAELGLKPLPFGYEGPITSCKLITLERSMVIEDLFQNIVNEKTGNWENAVFYFDRGLFLDYYPKQGLNLQVSVSNGEPVIIGDVTSGAYPFSGGISPFNGWDTDRDKVITGRIGQTIPGGEVGLSGIFGRRDWYADGSAENYVRAADFDVETVMGPLTVIGEAVAAVDGNINKNGAYLTGAVHIPDTKSQPYLRLDYENILPPTGGSVQSFTRGTIGYAYLLSKMSKVSAEYEIIDTTSGFAALSPGGPEPTGRVTVQYQVIFP